MGFYEQWVASRKAKRQPGQTITLITTCAEMMLESYIQYLETHDLRWFTKEFLATPDAEKAMIKFYGEMMSKLGDNGAVDRFLKMHKIIKLRGKYDAVRLLISAVRSHRTENGKEALEELIDQLRLWHYNIDKSKELFSQIERIENRIGGLLTEADLLEVYLDQDDKKEVVSIREQIISVVRILNLSYKIDTKETNVDEWIVLQISAKKQIEHEQRNRSRSKQTGT